MKHLKTIITMLLIAALLLPMGTVTLAADEDTMGYLYLRSGQLSEGQINIVRRARQMVEIEWTPVYNLSAWGREETFWAGTTYTGVPYGQPVHASYVGYSSTLTQFINACDNSRSRMYTEYSTFNKIAPFFSTDCSAFVSYCWDLKIRKTTRNMSDEAYLVEDQSLNALEVGDCLDDVDNHVILVTGVVRNDAGEVTMVETMESTPPLCCRRIYGGSTRGLDVLVDNYLNAGYKIYRYPDRDSVTYTHDCAVPIDGDYCANCHDKAPRAVITAGAGCKTVELKADAGAVIHYTTDGSTPTLNSPVYSSALRFDEPVMLRAIAWTGNFSSARSLSCNIYIDKCSEPVYSIAGMSKGTAVSYGSKVSLSSDTYGAKIYYTTDGSDPLAGQLYTAPITINADTRIRAIAMADGYSDSDAVDFSFTLRNFSSFTDVPAGAWYAGAVEYAYSMGLFGGTSKNTFSPDLDMTRGMFVTVLGRMAGVTSETGCEFGLVTGENTGLFSGMDSSSELLAVPGKGSMVSILGSENGWYRVSWNGKSGYIYGGNLKVYARAFSDVDTGAYYSPYVQWAYLTGITAGTGTGSFSPNAPISRQDLAMMLYNYASVTGKSLSEVNAGIRFTDDASILQTYRDAVYALGRAGIINGMGDGSFSPNGSATRAQVAQVIMNFVG